MLQDKTQKPRLNMTPPPSNGHAVLLTGLFFMAAQALAHDPVFSPGPHVLFKDGFELHMDSNYDSGNDEADVESALALKYGLTGDWVIGLEQPWQLHQRGDTLDVGQGDLVLSTKYRFWRKDRLGEQTSAALLFSRSLNTADTAQDLPSRTLVGLSYGYESLVWYHWASIRYLRFDRGARPQPGDRWLVDLAIGYRPSVGAYREPDWVWMIEFNSEYQQHNRLDRQPVADTGGRQWFLSPGLMWTARNFALKAGIQFPIHARLKGTQSQTDYRARIELEWHL
jgi:hypothetical protein